MRYYENTNKLAQECVILGIVKLILEFKTRYNRLVARMNCTTTEVGYISLAKDFRTMNGYEDTDKLAEKSKTLAVKTKYNRLVDEMGRARTEVHFQTIAKEFRSMNGYENTTELANDCETLAQKIINEKQGLCRHCGGKFKGFFSKKCSCCGKPKDY
jgi:hypothetical protein